jgi:hypothetical protein
MTEQTVDMSAKSTFVPDFYVFSPRTDEVAKCIEEWSINQSQTPMGVMRVKCTRNCITLFVNVHKVAERVYHFEGNLPAVITCIKDIVRDLPVSLQTDTTLRRLRREPTE